ncbi:MAG: hypothetical protein WAV15_03425 [Minisyncoccia bacterium]
MSFRKNNLFIGALVLFAFISIGVFGLLQFGHVNHASEAPMVDCPYAENGSSVCENTLDHIANWEQFSNVVVSSIFIFSLLILGILYFINQQDFLNQNKHFNKWRHFLYNKKSYSSTYKIIKWLSLFENSPSFSYTRHS